MDGMRQRIGRVKSVSQKRPSPPLFGGVARSGGAPCFTVPPTAARSKSTEDRERSFADPCIEISIYNDVKDRRSGAFVIQREARDPDGRGPGPNLYIASPRRGRLILRESTQSVADTLPPLMGDASRKSGPGLN